MEEIKYILQIIAKFLAFNIVFYLLASFIAWDLNPLDWELITEIMGRIIFIGIELFIIALSIKSDDY